MSRSTRRPAERLTLRGRWARGREADRVEQLRREHGRQVVLDLAAFGHARDRFFQRQLRFMPITTEDREDLLLYVDWLQRRLCD